MKQAAGPLQSWAAAALLVAASALASANADPARNERGDSAWYDQAEYRQSFAGAREPTTTHRYLTMPDGVKIAITVSLPPGVEPEDRLPTLLMQTRYWRAADEGRGTAGLYTSRGYAFVATDVRGTGASSGVHRGEFLAGEIDDGAGIMQWIVEQPWSNGRIGTIGTSYTGGTSALTLGHDFASHVAAITSAIPFDFYEGLFKPGGLTATGVIGAWGRLIYGLDTNTPYELFGRTSVPEGLVPVDADEDSRQLAELISDRRDKVFRIEDYLSTVEFRDDAGPDALGDPLTPDDMSMHRSAALMARSEAAVLDVTGWFDLAFAPGTIQRFHRFPAANRKVVIGPWEHHGYYVSPARSDAADDSPEHGARWRSAHYLRFMDHYLGGIDTGAGDDAPIHYFTMGEEKWKETSVWPPAGTTPCAFFLAAGNGLSAGSPGEGEAADTYRVDFTATSGPTSRYMTGVGVPMRYDRAGQKSLVLSYRSERLEHDVEVTGRPKVVLFMSSTTQDAAVHVYLEELLPDGQIRYITEGVLRASHRRVSEAPYPTVDTYHSHLRRDAKPLVPGEVVTLVIDMLPTSYLFKAGNSFQVSIAGADQDNFERVPNDGSIPVFRIHKSALYPSRIELPIVNPDR